MARLPERAKLLQLPAGLQTRPFPIAQGALNHFLLLISALPLTAHQQLCNLPFILLSVWAFGYLWEEGETTGNCASTDFRITQLNLSHRLWRII